MKKKIIWRNILPVILQTITRKPRYHPEDYELDHKMHWSREIWVSNIFRAYEWLFGREYGIRAEVSSSSRFENGQQIISYELYTLEAVLCAAEVAIREFLSEKLLPFKLYNLQLVTNPNYKDKKIQLPGIMFAIVLDVANNGTATSTSPITWSHTCTGSNLILAVLPDVISTNGTPTISSVTYNSVAMTSNSAASRLHAATDVYLLANPSTGSNTVSFAFSATAGQSAVGGAFSYSGANQSSTADANAHNSNIASGAKTVTVTTIANNCWVAATMANEGISPTLTLATHTERYNVANSSNGVSAGQDTNGPKTPAGGVSIGWTVGGSSLNWALSAASFAPVATGTTNHFLSLMGVGS